MLSGIRYDAIFDIHHERVRRHALQGVSISRLHAKGRGVGPSGLKFTARFFRIKADGNKRIHHILGGYNGRPTVNVGAVMGNGFNLYGILRGIQPVPVRIR